MWTVYRLTLMNRGTYFGVTSNLERRLFDHMCGNVGFSEHPWRSYCVIYESEDREDAFRVEAKLISRVPCSNKKSSGTKTEKQREASRNAVRRLREGEWEMWGRKNVPALRRALNGEVLDG